MKKSGFMSFDFWQKFGKALMVVIAVMPAAGIMISLGKLVAMSGGDIAVIATIAKIMEEIGWAIIGNLHVLFAVAIGGSWAKAPVPRQCQTPPDVRRSSPGWILRFCPHLT